MPAGSVGISVLVVGAGPIGLTLAADLGQRGVRCTVIEQSDGRVGPAKMLQVGVRTVEFCRRMGIAEKVKNWGFPQDFPLDNVFVTNLNGYELARIRPTSGGSAALSRFSPERQCHCPQTVFDPIMGELARSYPSTEFLFRSRLESFSQDDEGVVAQIRDLDSGIMREFVADYMVGCDGFSSTVRKLVGIDMRGVGALDTSINVEFVTEDLASLHNKGNAVRYICIGPEGTWATLVAIDGRQTWRLTLYGANNIDVKAIDVSRAIRRAVGRDFNFSIKSVGEWVRRGVVADRFHDGRVFLAGDAAHTHPPNGGYGMNTGIADAIDLGWKLGAVNDGWGDPRILDSYDIERRPVCHRAVNESVKEYYRLTEDSGREEIESGSRKGEAQRHAFGASLQSANEKSKSWQPFGIHLGYSYDPSPIVVSDGSPPLVDDTIDYFPVSRPGSRAPHAWLPDGRSILDFFGGDYVLLRFGTIPVDATPLLAAARRRQMPIVIHDITDRNVETLYERKLVLVRPDGHVAWRADRVPAEPHTILDRVRGAGPRAAALGFAPRPKPCSARNLTLSVQRTGDLV